jgi:hypothetical protein
MNGNTVSLTFFTVWLKSHFIFSHWVHTEINMKGRSSKNKRLRPSVQKTRSATLRGLSIILLLFCFTYPYFRATVSLLSSIHEPLPLPRGAYPHVYLSISLFISLPSSAMISKQTPLIIGSYANASRLKNLPILPEWCSGPMRPKARGPAQPERRHGSTRVPGHAFLA